MKTVFDLSRDEIVALTDEDISLYIDRVFARLLKEKQDIARKSLIR